MPGSSPHVTDIAIIGAGPTGLFAVFEAGMLKMQCAVLDALAFAGGQCSALYPEKPIYDIPAYPVIEAQTLIDRLLEQADPFKPAYFLGQQVVRFQAHPGGGFTLHTATEEQIQAKAILIAGGCGAFGPNRPPLPGIEEYEGRSVFYHITRKDQFRGKHVVIAGGGDSAVDWALSLCPVAASVAVVHRRSKFRCAPDSAHKLQTLHDQGNLQLVIPYQLHALEGAHGQLEAVVVSDLDNRQRTLRADVLLPFFGLSTELGPIAQWGLSLDKHHITVDPATLQTSIPGVYAIGDIVTYPGKLKLILSGFAEAAMAAHAIYPCVHPDEALHFEYSTSKGVPAL